MDGLVLTGRLVFLKEEKSKESGRVYRRLQVMCHGGQQRAQLYDVTDMSKCNLKYGEIVSLPVSLQVWPGKNGPGYGFTHWGERSLDTAPAASVPPAGKI